MVVTESETDEVSTSSEFLAITEIVYEVDGESPVKLYEVSVVQPESTLDVSFVTKYSVPTGLELAFHVTPISVVETDVRDSDVGMLALVVVAEAVVVAALPSASYTPISNE